LDNKVDMNRENIKQSLVHYELKQHKYKNWSDISFNRYIIQAKWVEVIWET
jgi:hypothetical protein